MKILFLSSFNKKKKGNFLTFKTFFNIFESNTKIKGYFLKKDYNFTRPRFTPKEKDTIGGLY
jgi:hypothetical protein